MRLVLPAVAFASLVTAVPAQEYFGYQGNGVQSLTRAGLDHQGGEIHMGFLQQYNRGLGDNGKGCAIDQMYLFLRDNEGSTLEDFAIVVRSGNDRVGPYPGASALLHRFPGWNLGPGSGVRMNCLTFTFSSPLKLPNCRNFFSFGIEIPANHSWPSDGLCLLGQNQASHSVNAHALRPNWTIKAGATQRSPYSDWTYQGCFGLAFSNTPIIRMGEYGGHSGMKGLNGHWPTVGQSLQAMIHYGPGMDGGLSMLYVGLGRQPGITLLANSPQFYLTNPVLFLTGATIGTGCCGHTEHDLVPSVPASWTNLGKFHFQSVGISGSKAQLSNVFTTRF